MDTTNLLAKFARMGARVQVAQPQAARNRAAVDRVTLDVRSDGRGEYFQVLQPRQAETAVEVLDVQAADRHLLLLVREGQAKHKFLCGHDERHWFVAAIPERAAVGTVRQAKDALKPPEVREAEVRRRVPSGERNRRRNAAFVRQGEWFFLPVPGFSAPEALVLRDEPLRRSTAGKPHWAEFAFRTGGELVMVCRRHPRGITQEQHARLLADNPRARTWGWRPMRRNPGVYVRGHVRHADHQTIVLRGWHRVVMNTENQSVAMRNVAFLD